MTTQRVAGFCPMGCGKTLILGAGGHVTCSYAHCPDPGRVDTILDDDVTEHVVKIGKTGFDIKHPLRERADDELFDCQLHAWMSALAGPPHRPGRYLAVADTDDNHRWGFIEILPLTPPEVDA